MSYLLSLPHTHSVRRCYLITKLMDVNVVKTLYEAILLSEKQVECVLYTWQQNR